MRLTVLGGVGAWPTASQACSGYLVEHDGFTLLVDPGYSTFPALQALMPASAVDAVLVSHGHPDHCADLNPLLRARALGGSAPVLPLYAPEGALDRVLALDQVRLDSAYSVHPVERAFEVGPFRVDTYDLPHFVPNAGLRLTAGGRVLAYTGDTGPSPVLLDLARDADVFVAEATFARQVAPADNAPYLSTAVQAGANADRAGAGRLVLAHLWPGSDPAEYLEAADYPGDVDVAAPGLVIDL
ncbi:ribonuclease BN (tRNA processing enzyme) [Saccharothrix ecbatanensis]|uniref:Ribonuclease BN (tRNA processing enzyme) n=1 Tax=Saccharothrix ecbatanensis TaxID=1105145 RepID=A0A7W9M475_9PSEU|nr:MBL fold metallo-hydrolase [Saccharothrix ecbatanensis]MBB5806815.1 ribonuclease BN (tRNA processing enzyme) [Saccharothrix ecbatanensis]